MTVLIIAAVLLILAGISKAIKDMIAEGHYDKQWWNKDLSWPLKWKNGDPKQGEKFLFSSTLLVWLTDGWHLFQMIEIVLVFVAMAVSTLSPWWLEALAGSAIYLTAFELVYRLLKKKA